MSVALPALYNGITVAFFNEFGNWPDKSEEFIIDAKTGDIIGLTNFNAAISIESIPDFFVFF